MKTISVIVPSFNEEESIFDLYLRTTAVMQGIQGYNYEIIFVDDGSTDKSRDIIEDLCQKDSHIKAIFSMRNFGYSKTIFYGLQQAQGDCAVLLHADLQNPPEVIPEFVRQWESGYKIILGIKSGSKENKALYFFRKCYYSVMNRISDIEHIRQATDFELLDRSFLDVLRCIHMNTPYLRGLIIEYGYKIKLVQYNQDKREKGKTHFSFYKYYDFAMLGITSSSKKFLRLATLFGLCLSFASSVILIVFLAAQITRPEAGTQFFTNLIILILFIVSSLQFFFIGMLGEYVLSIINNSSNKPIVTEAKRINFSENQ